MAVNTESVRDSIDHELAESVKIWNDIEGEEEAFADFMHAALSEILQILEDNRKDAEAMGILSHDDPTAEEVLSPENCRDVEYEADRFKGKRVTVWLRDCPNWANTASTQSFYVRDGLNARNGKVQAVLDCRPF